MLTLKFKRIDALLRNATLQALQAHVEYQLSLLLPAE